MMHQKTMIMISLSIKQLYPWAHSGTVISLLIINRIDDKILFSHKNHPLLPTGFASKKYIDELTRLMNEWLQDSPMKGIC